MTKTILEYYIQIICTSSNLDSPTHGVKKMCLLTLTADGGGVGVLLSKSEDVHMIWMKYSKIFFVIFLQFEHN